jgi:prolyl-tRNA editing enzyme YbaK/EbsC (Cys-tRNA(Pro) deacylase)
MKVFETIISILEREQVAYQLLHHEPSRTSIESAQERGDSIENGAKALILKIGENYGVFVMRAYLKLDFKKVHRLTGVKAKKICFATSNELLYITGLVPGSIPPFGYPVMPMTLYIDQSICDGHDWIGFNAGRLTESIKMRKQDYLRIANGQIAQFTLSIITS